MTAIEWDVATALCPPDPDAVCGHCGLELHVHQTDDGPGMMPTPSNAVCIDDAALLTRRIVWNRFKLAAGQTFDCPHASFCEQCMGPICPEHTTGFTTCVDQRFTYHHLKGCVEDCSDCMRGVAEDSAEGYAIELWKGVA